MIGEKETTEPQALVAAGTPQDQIDQLREELAEHATHLDLLQKNADSQRTNWAAERMRLNAIAPEVKELRAVLADIMGRVETLEVKDIQRSEDLATANKATDLLAQYRRMVGNLFRRVADAVDGG